ncbi:hypothetical protein AcV7_000995 [Taiwanofungus camphoratus]|nr:hypothetical protein AcV7_000995 [Antrodia cinnamomea]
MLGSIVFDLSINALPHETTREDCSFTRVRTHSERAVIMSMSRDAHDGHRESVTITSRTGDWFSSLRLLSVWTPSTLGLSSSHPEDTAFPLGSCRGRPH